MTTTDQGEVNASLMGIELATIARMAVVLVNWAMANIGKQRKISVYMDLTTKLLHCNTSTAK